jgi:hypothetical protein
MMKLLLIASLFILTNISFAGGSMDSGGGDIKAEDYGAAWFLGDRTVKYCAKFGATFPVDEQRTLVTIENVFKQWVTFMKKVDVDDWRYGDRPDLAKKISRKFEYQKECGEDTDLYFYFAEESNEIKRAKELYDNVQAFAHRISYDKDTGRGKGLIYLNGYKHGERTIDWSEEHKLHGMLLHEIGHVLGCSHVPGTIMSEDVAELLIDGHLGVNALMIERSTDVNTTDDDFLNNTFDGLLDFDNARGAETFKLLTGKVATGIVKSSFAFGKKFPQDLIFIPITLTLSDDNSSHTIDADLVMRGVQGVDSPNYFFKSLQRPKSTPYYELGWMNKISIYSTYAYGRIKDFNGNNHTLLFEYNFEKHVGEELRGSKNLNYDINYSQVPFQLFFLDEKGSKLRLFGPSAYWEKYYYQ